MLKLAVSLSFVLLLLSEAIEDVQVEGPDLIPKGKWALFSASFQSPGLNPLFLIEDNGIIIAARGLPNAATGTPQTINFGIGCNDQCEILVPFIDTSTGKECIDFTFAIMSKGIVKSRSKSRTFCCSKQTGSGGEPHFSTFHGDLFDYHGVCDLVLSHSNTFAEGKGMDLHVRTEEFGNHFSIISNAALRIGEDVLEVNKEGDHVINGVNSVPLPAKLAGQFMVTKTSNQDAAAFDPNVSHGFSKQELKDSILFSIDLGDNAFIEIQSWKGMLWVNTVGSMKTFEDSSGLVGTWSTPGKISRDGKTDIADAAEYAENWQVLDTEPKLFQNVTHPQHPTPCVSPAPIVPYRRLGEESRAKRVCSGVTNLYFDACVFDVMVTGDDEMAHMYLKK